MTAPVTASVTSVDVADLAVGDVLPGATIELTPTFVVRTAIASRDFEEVHHDVEVARANGLEHIFLNILTTNGLCQRVVVDWAGPDAIVRSSAVRLGVPALAGTSLELTAVISGIEHGDGEGRVTVEVIGMVPGGRHCKATVVIGLPTDNDDGKGVGA